MDSTPKTSPIGESPVAATITKEVASIKKKGKFSPETKKMVDELLILSADAGKSGTDIKPLELAYKALRKALSLSKSLEAANIESQKAKALLELGDWTAAITNAAKNQEGEAASAQEGHLRKGLKAKGLSEADISATLFVSREWRVAYGYMAEETYSTIKAELAAVNKWRADGEDEGTAPQTPGLDRLDGICTGLNISRLDYIRAVKLYSDRNALAHHKPPLLENYRKADGTTDWKSIESDCEAYKVSLESLREAGVLSETKFALHVGVINAWFRLHVKGWDAKGDAVETDHTQKTFNKIAKEKAKSLKRKAIPAPEFPYKKGKWDDIPGEETEED